MIKAENIIIKERYKGLKNLVLICDAMDEFAKQYHKEQLTIHNVSQQRELLNAFVDFYNDRQLNSDNICYDEIDLFLDSI